VVTEGSLKEFFKQVREKNQHRMDLLMFLVKLLEVLEYEKNAELAQKVNENKNS
jgi:hypothetical protein